MYKQYKIGKSNSSTGAIVWLVDHEDNYISFRVQAAYQEAAKRTRMAKDGSVWVIQPIEQEVAQ